MAETPFRSLSLDDRRYTLNFAADRSGRRAYLLEKDIRVIETLRVLVEAPFGRHGRVA